MRIRGRLGGVLLGWHWLAWGEGGTPDVLGVHSAEGLTPTTWQFHESVRACEAHPTRPRPVVLNTWEAVYFDHDTAKLQALALLRDKMEARLVAEAGVTVFGTGAERLPQTSNFAVPGFRAETQVMALDLAGVAVSSGSACSSGKVKRSLVLGAMGVPDDLSDSAIRVSFGWDSKPEDFDNVADAWIEAMRRANS